MSNWYETSSFIELFDSEVFFDTMNQVRRRTAKNNIKVYINEAIQKQLHSEGVTFLAQLELMKHSFENDAEQLAIEKIRRVMILNNNFWVNTHLGREFKNVMRNVWGGKITFQHAASELEKIISETEKILGCE